ncbi:hypothetical protein ACH3VR_01175 [Microbacterium sp. B2969]|uniref:HTH HARE-type domain-containing protein n=1 Tax=Microbacterium alkaliflavum TaxID=3248839 RepID=A0ABW7Q2A8_9MICO
MEDDQLRETLATLRNERRGAEARASALQEELTEVGKRLIHLKRAVESIEALLGEMSEEDQEILSMLTDDEEPRPASMREVDFTNTPDVIVSPRKRVPSTDWVAEVVEAIGQPADRDTIFEKFEELKGIPESWNANPRNSFNNALGRAVERGMVLKVNDNEFVSKDWDPFGTYLHRKDEES